jgi:hypothetical protein
MIYAGLTVNSIKWHCSPIAAGINGSAQSEVASHPAFPQRRTSRRRLAEKMKRPGRTSNRGVFGVDPAKPRLVPTPRTRLA